jgi:nicotinamidase-related amidase
MPVVRAEPDRCALVIVDGQRFMTDRDGGFGAEAAARGITAEFKEYYLQAEAAVANAGRLAKAFRDRGGLVVHTLIASGPRLSRQLRLSRLRFPQEDEAVSGIRPELGPEPNDVVLTRGTYGAFVSGELAAELDGRHIDCVFLAGMPANPSVALTAREAADRNYRVVVVQDAVAAETLEWHSVTMTGLAGGAIRLAWAEEVIEMLDGTRT